jgi:holliday junction DNA helicase RuvA
MIAQLRGMLADKRPNQLIVEVGGVGYLVNIPLSTFYAVGGLREEVVLLVHTHVREDSLALYGFLTAREKHLFEMLLSASGVGPTLALKILSGMSADELGPAIREGDIARLTRIPGVGKKTAERMVVELRDRLAAAEPEAGAAATAAGRGGVSGDVVSALLNLGYDSRAAEAAVERAVSGEQGNSKAASLTSKGAAPAGNFEAVLRAALHELSAPGQKGKRV